MHAGVNMWSLKCVQNNNYMYITHILHDITIIFHIALYKLNILLLSYYKNYQINCCIKLQKHTY